MDIYRLARPLLFALPPERAHRLTIAALQLLGPGTPPVDPPSLATRIAGLSLPNPIGLAAGFDKDAEAFPALFRLGFGFVEVGTLTPLPQSGNPRPRMARLVEDEAVINRLGFNNHGQEGAMGRLEARRSGVLGINLGANKDSPDRVSDYAAGVANLARLANYLTINISSPNTPGLRALQTADSLAALLDRAIPPRPRPPVFVKIAPDLDEAELEAIAATALSRDVDGLIATNTTLARDRLRSPASNFEGGLSGAPLFSRSTEVLRQLRSLTRGRIALIGVGGVRTAMDAYMKIRAGADAVQLYTALVYGGPAIIGEIKKELALLLARDGFETVADAVGADV